MKTVAFAFDAADASWIRDMCAGGGSLGVVATTFAAQQALARAEISFETFEEEAWAVDKPACADRARRFAAHWHEWAGEKGLVGFASPVMHREFPVLPILFHTVYHCMNEFFQAEDFIRRVIDKLAPDEVVLCQRRPPFERGFYGLLAAEEGLEPEVLEGLCLARQIGVRKVAAPRLSEGGGASELSLWGLLRRKVQTVWRDPYVIRRRLRRRLGLTPSANAQPLEGFSPKGRPVVLLQTARGGYLEQVLPLIVKLVSKGCEVVVLVSHEHFSPVDERRLLRVGATLVRYNGKDLEAELQPLREMWTERGQTLVESLFSSVAGMEISSDGCEGGVYCARFIFEHALVTVLPEVVINLERQRRVLARLRPNVLFAHFSTGSHAVSEVLPARAAGIPTVTMGHGLHVYTETERDVYSAAVYAAVGKVQQGAIQRVFGTPLEALPVAGDSRFERMRPKGGRWRVLRRFGLDPTRPVCVVCVTGPWSQAREGRHIEAVTYRAVLDVMEVLPDLQVVYRMHPGTNVQAFADEGRVAGRDIVFQVAPTPSLSEMLRGADVVVSHQGSVLAESVLCGVQAVYLSVSAIAEPSCLDCPVIHHAARFDELPALVGRVLDMHLSTGEVRKAAKPWLEKVACGVDGMAAERMSDCIVKLAAEGGVIGFDDWLARQRASAAFSSAYWKTLTDGSDDTAPYDAGGLSR